MISILQYELACQKSTQSHFGIKKRNLIVENSEMTARLNALDTLGVYRFRYHQYVPYVWYVVRYHPKDSWLFRANLT